MARNKYRSNGFGNVWAILNGRAGAIKAAGIQTDVEFSVRQTERGTKADIQSIHGNTLVWNQMIENGDFQSGAYWSVAGQGAMTVADGVMSYVQNGGADGEGIVYYGAEGMIVSGHKYLISIYARLSEASDAIYSAPYFSKTKFTRVSGSETGKLTTDFRNYSAIVSANSDFGNLQYINGVRVLKSGDAGVALQIKSAYFFDLTVMYGAGNEPATVADFREWFSREFYPFSEPRLLNFTGTGIKSEGEGWSETRVLPTETCFPTGMKSTGSVYDELTPDKAITRVGSRTYEEGDENDPTVITDGTTTLYPLATPTEIPISPPLNLSYRVEKGGTETLLPINGSVPTTTPFVGTIDYLIDYTGIVNALTLLRRLDLRDEDFLTIGLALIESRAREAEEDDDGEIPFLAFFVPEEEGEDAEIFPQDAEDPDDDFPMEQMISEEENGDGPDFPEVMISEEE